MKPKPKRAAKLLPRRNILGLFVAALAASIARPTFGRRRRWRQTWSPNEWHKTWQLIEIIPLPVGSALDFREYFYPEIAEHLFPIKIFKDEKILSADVWAAAPGRWPASAALTTDSSTAAALNIGEFVNFELDHWPDAKFRHMVRDKNGKWRRYYEVTEADRETA